MSHKISKIEIDVSTTPKESVLGYFCLHVSFLDLVFVNVLDQSLISRLRLEAQLFFLSTTYCTAPVHFPGSA